MKALIKKLPIAILFAFALSACTPSPKSVTKKFLVAMSQGKTEEAKQYCTESTAKMIDLAASLGAIKPKPDTQIEIIGDSIAGEKAFVFYKENGRKETAQLYKIDGEWKVNMESKK